jgi:hypothetical protein
MMAHELTIGKRQLRAACDAWGWTTDTGGGSMGLALWLSRHKAHFTVKDYSELIELVRAETGDTTDYSKE